MKKLFISFIVSLIAVLCAISLAACDVNIDVVISVDESASGVVSTVSGNDKEGSSSSEATESTDEAEDSSASEASESSDEAEESSSSAAESSEESSSTGGGLINGGDFNAH